MNHSRVIRQPLTLPRIALIVSCVARCTGIKGSSTMFTVRCTMHHLWLLAFPSFLVPSQLRSTSSLVPLRVLGARKEGWCFLSNAPPLPISIFIFSFFVSGCSPLSNHQLESGSLSLPLFTTPRVNSHSQKDIHKA